MSEQETSPFETARRRTRAFVLEPEVRGRARLHGDGEGTRERREPAQRLEEAVGLAQAIDLDIVDAFVAPLQKLTPATLLGSGKVEEIGVRVEAEEIELVVIDGPLSPLQQRNLERAWKAKVLDRTGLILEIFGERAQTREGRLQVELAHLDYQRSRLVRSWTHLERQRGGFGFLGGPGETQIEADRRLLRDRIRRIEGQLENVRRTRTLHRRKRKKAPQPVAALVGYTNAGKSTLFNRLTSAGVLQEDMLFATLDPTLRRIEFPSGAELVLSDTVGFIADLPTMLVEAFRATLEEVIEADIIVHVHDVADPDWKLQAEDVARVLCELGIEREDGVRHFVDVYNKIDLLDAERRADIVEIASRADSAPILMSAATGEGVPILLDELERSAGAGKPMFNVRVGAEAMGDVGWLYKNAEIVGHSEADDQLRLRVRIPQKRLDAFRDWAARDGVEAVEA